jgi:hypothetical protein
MMDFVDFWSGVAFNSDGGGSRGGAPSTSPRPQARPDNLDTSGPSFSSGDSQRENADRAAEIAASQKRVSNKAAADRAAFEDAARNAFQQNAANKAAADRAAADRAAADRAAADRAAFEDAARNAFQQNAANRAAAAARNSAPSPSPRPQARPDNLDTSGPSFSESDTQRENADRAAEIAASQKRVSDAAAAEAEAARNSFLQDVANTFTPGDGEEYVDGVLVGGGGGVSDTRPQARPDNLDTSVTRTDFPTLSTESDDNATRLAAANAADVAEQVRIDRIKNIALEAGKENSFYQNTMNKITPGDGKEYIGGELVETVGSGTFGAGVKDFLGAANADDLAVGYVDGQRIFRRPDGTTYTRDSMGFIYDTSGPDTLDRADDSSSGNDVFGENAFGNKGDSDTPVVEEEEEDPVVEPEECPIGYKKNPDTSPGAEPCIIDPFQDPFPCLEGYVLDPETQTCVPDTGAGAGPVVPVDPGLGPVVGADPCPEGYILDQASETCVVDPNYTPDDFDGGGSFDGGGPLGPFNTSAYTEANPLSALPTLAPGARPSFSVPRPTVQPITIRQQGLASLPFRNG